MKIKVEYNIKIKEYNTLKVDLIRLEVNIFLTPKDDNKRNNKIIEEFINEASKYSPEINKLITPIDENNTFKQEPESNNEALNDNFISNYNSNNSNKLTFTHINPGNIIKLREVQLIFSFRSSLSIISKSKYYTSNT